jgi:glucose-6-phosphate-specific signal transduction histidine kinase
MTNGVQPVDDFGRREPWFARRPRMALSVALLLFTGIFALQFIVHGTADSLSELYVLPVALVAFAFGYSAAMVAGGVAVTLLVTWAIITDTSLSPLGWMSSVGLIVLLGALVGVSADRIREARRAERYAYEISLMQRDAAEVNDTVVQSIAAAKWMLEAGQIERAGALLDETASTAQGLVSRVLGAASALTDDVRRPHRVLYSSDAE